jgi:drug/metabolite transporter (DMT)-like permease
MSGSSHQDRPFLGLAIRLVGIAGFATMAALIKLASERGMHIAEIIFWRQLVSIPILLGWVLMAGGISLLATDRPKTHAVRGVYGILGMLCNFGAVILLPLSEATTINFTSPIWAVLLSVVLLHEKVGIWRWSAVILGFSGILVIAQPGGNQFPLEGTLVAMGGAFMIALISIQIRDLSKTERPVTIVFWFAMMSVVVTAPILPFVMVEHTLEDWLLLLGIGLAGTWGQLLVTMALRYGAVASIIVMDYSSLIWATLFGFLLFDRLPPGTTWIGAPLIIAAGLVIAWREHALHKQRSIAEPSG